MKLSLAAEFSSIRRLCARPSFERLSDFGPARKSQIIVSEPRCSLDKPILKVRLHGRARSVVVVSCLSDERLGPTRPSCGNRKETMTALTLPPVNGSERAENGAKNSQLPGMTLKDWFAGQIVAAMMGSDPSNSNQRDSNGQLCKMDQSKLVNMARSAYQVAEAMMQARAAS
jgi:hypothetical protein